MRTPEQALFVVLVDLLAIHQALAEHHRRRLAAAPPGSRLRRWQSRTLSGLRAAQKAEAKTAASILRLKRHMLQGGHTNENCG